MVQKNIYEEDLEIDSSAKSENNIFSDFNIPAASERFLAGLLDVIFMFSFGYLSIAPTLKKISTSIVTSFSNDSNDHLSTYLIFIIFDLLIVHIIYQTFFIYWKNATPGMILRGLKVKSISLPNYQKVTFIQALVRAILMCLESFFAFFPMLEVLTHPQGRSLHDRGADTVVVSISKVKNKMLPHETEIYFFKQVHYLFFLGIGFYSLMSIFHSQITILTQSSTQSDANFSEGKVNLCSEVNSNLNVGEERLDLVLAQYISKHIDDECFNEELDTFFWSKNLKSSGLAYLAKAIQIKSQGENYREYLDYVCHKSPQNQDYCIWSKDELGENIRIEEMKKVSENSTSLSFKVFALNWGTKKHELNFTKEILKSFNDYDWAQQIVGESRIKLNWFENKLEQALGGLQILTDLKGSQKSISLLSWFCKQELKQINGAEKSECLKLEKIAAQNIEFRSQIEVSLTLLKARSFSERSKIDSEEMGKWFVENGWTELVEYYNQSTSEQNKSFPKNLENLLAKGVSNSEIKDEIMEIYESHSLKDGTVFLRNPASIIPPHNLVKPKK